MTEMLKLREVIEIAEKVDAYIERWKIESTEPDWQGSEDLADALGYIGDLFRQQDAHMIQWAYRDLVDAEFQEGFTKRVAEADEDAKHAMEQLQIMQFITTIDDI